MTDKPLLTLDDIWELKRYAHDHETLCYAVQRTVLSRQAEQSASAPTVRPPVHSYTENGQALYTGESVAMLIANALRASASATSVQEHVGWSDEFGNLFPLAAYKPKSATWRDGHKTTWRPVYSPAPTPAQESRPQGHNPEKEKP